MTSVLNVDAPVSALGYFGPSPPSHGYATTTLEELSVWDLQAVVAELCCCCAGWVVLPGELSARGLQACALVVIAHSYFRRVPPQAAERLAHFSPAKRPEPGAEIGAEIAEKVAEAPRVDYIVGCAWDSSADSAENSPSGQLLALCGDHGGSCHVYAVEPSGLVGLGGLIAESGRGHCSDIRAFHCGADGRVLTAGDDARLCLWAAP